MNTSILLEQVRGELQHARENHSDMHSAHEGYAVIREELDELWDEIKKRDADKDLMRAEALQVAAMALRFIEDVCDSHVPRAEGEP